MKTILVVDDHPIVLEGLHNVLTMAGFNVVKATSADQAISLTKHLKGINLLLIDLSLEEGTDGLDLIHRLRESGFHKPAVIYTMHEELWNISLLLEAGVEGIVLKGDDINELILAVKTVAAGGTYRSASFSERSGEVSRTKGILSEKDLEVLRLLGKGESSRDIADKIGIGEKTVEYHRSNILRKLKSRNIAEAISHAVRLGIISCMAGVSVCAAATSACASSPVAVDLGLSVRWSDRNLGAGSPLDAGGFYAFAETATKDYYDWSTYTHCIDGDWSLQTDIGEESIAATGYDAAFTSLGEGWRLPLADEIEELIACTTSEYVDGSPYGYVRLTASNGEWVDFPLTGYMSLGKIVHAGKECVCWSGSFYVEQGDDDGTPYYINTPYIMGVSKDAPVMVEGSVHLGLSVRPVFAGTVSVGTAIAGTKDEHPAIFSIDGRRVEGSVGELPPGMYIMIDGGTTRKILR